MLSSIDLCLSLVTINFISTCYMLATPGGSTYICLSNVFYSLDELIAYICNYYGVCLIRMMPIMHFELQLMDM